MSDEVSRLRPYKITASVSAEEMRQARTLAAAYNCSIGFMVRCMILREFIKMPVELQNVVLPTELLSGFRKAGEEVIK
jgi:hypothetical protein